MSKGMRKLLFCVLGLLAGLVSWSVSEGLLYLLPDFDSYFTFSLVLGASLGAIFGAFIGSAQGISYSIPRRIKSGWISGLCIGVPGGALGFLVGQESLFLLGEYSMHSNQDFQQFAIPISRIVGWTSFGVFVGVIEGVRSFSMVKIKIGVLGGLLGGLFGGIAMEGFQLFLQNIEYSRLFGFLVLGLLIAFMYSLVEGQFSQGLLKLLNGDLKGKEYLLLQGRNRLGSSPKMDIQINKYSDILPDHANFLVHKGNVTYRSVNQSKILINDEPAEADQRLKMEDVIQVGSAKFLFAYQ